MPICSVIGCANRSYKKSKFQLIRESDTKISFHKFPKNPVRRQQWLQAINRVGWTPTLNNVICSEHFEERYFDRTSMQSIRLRENAVPTILQHQHKLLDLDLYNFAHSISASNEAPVLEIAFDEDFMDTSNSVDSVTKIVHKKSSSPRAANTSTVLLKFNDLNNADTKDKYSTVASKQLMIRKIKDLHYIHKIHVLQQIIQNQKKKIINLRNVLSNLRNQNFLPEKEKPGVNSDLSEN